MNTLWDWFWMQVPWGIQFIVIAGIFGVPALLIGMMLFGVKPTLQVLGAVLGIAAVIAAASKFRQEGYKQRLDEEEEAQERADEIQERIEDVVHDLPDADLDKEVDRWTKS